MKHSFRDVKRHSCHFCLALCSVFIVVLSTLVVNTVVSKGPIIFLSLAQAETGEIDVWYTSNTHYAPTNITLSGYHRPIEITDYSYSQGLNTYASYSYFFNYTQVKRVYGDNTYNLAPRMQLSSGGWEPEWVQNTTFLLPNASIYIIDLKREDEINVGVFWKYKDLAGDECVLTADYQSQYGL